jgi:hypothetical protein
LIYFATDRAVHAFMLSGDQYANWQIPVPKRLKGQIAAVLRAMGQLDDNKQLSQEQLKDDRWKATAQLLLGQVIEKRQHGFWNKFPRLVIIPDGDLWYVPFEALQIPAGDQTDSLSSKVRIRYLPLASLIVPDQRRDRPLSNTAVVVGRLFPNDDPRTAVEAFDAVQGVLPGAAAVGVPPAAPTGLMRCVWDRLVVLDDIDNGGRGDFSWSPAQIDQGRPDGSLARWMQLPWGGPEQIVLPGFKTDAGNALKRSGNLDMSMAICGLMASGARTILISRWRTGGQTSFDLVREFLQELPHAGAADAWHRSVQLTRSTEIDPEREPRVEPSKTGEPVSADHPFLWSGYMLVDVTGPPPPENQ